jgi:hypothetical protein
MRPPAGELFGYPLHQPTVCFLSIRFMWAALVCFVVAAAVVAVAGLAVV